MTASAYYAFGSRTQVLSFYARDSRLFIVGLASVAGGARSSANKHGSMRNARTKLGGFAGSASSRRRRHKALLGEATRTGFRPARDIRDKPCGDDHKALLTITRRLSKILEEK